MTKEKLPKAKYGSPDRPLQLGELKLAVYVLDDGTRVIVQRKMIEALGMSQGSSAGTGGDRLAKFASGKLLKPFINNDLAILTQNPIKFAQPRGGRAAYGYEATVLADLCEAVLKARDAGVLQKNQLHIAAQCEILMRSFAKVGIIALIDEATGYQFDRKHDALRILIEAYIEEELQPWIKTFPDSFFSALDTLYKNDKTTSRGRPQYYGKFINKYIYDPLERGYIKQELNKKNITDTGKRKARFHQWLTEKGRSQLILRIGKIEAIMETNPNLKKFKEKVKGLTQLTLFDNLEDNS